MTTCRFQLHLEKLPLMTCRQADISKFEGEINLAGGHVNSKSSVKNSIMRTSQYVVWNFVWCTLSKDA